ncbi:MAG TPA: glycosyltransferase N-terminal domain-containing protein, partial [Candidatus Krumholzibacterium sp.]|nr:glycosyltransferase N-terminal domain-containing protein [Candidatus Krumholzibacterium sp.]
VLLSAAISGGSRMFSGPAGWFFRPLYRSIDLIGAVSEEDSLRLAAFTGDSSRITVTGDVRFDQVVRRIDSPTAEIPRALRDDPRSIIIAGSTWPRDEEIVIPGFRKLKESFPDSLLVIAPHEPAPERISQIMASLKREGMSGEALSLMEETGPVKADIVIADGVGYLAELYTAGDIAYIGGSWTSGIHNVLEPAVAGLPVFFGPKFGNAWEAGVLMDIGAAFTVTGPADFAGKTLSLLSDRPALRKAGRTASDYIRNNTGASTRSLELIEEALWPVKD